MKHPLPSTALAALLILWAAVPATALALEPQSNAEPIDRYPDLDWEPFETIEFHVPAGSTYAISVDWALEEVEVNVKMDALGDHFGADSGCVSVASMGLNWESYAQPGSSTQTCWEKTLISGSVSSTTHFCVTTNPFCGTLADGTGTVEEDGKLVTETGHIQISCIAPSYVEADWKFEDYEVHVVCDVFETGLPSTLWDDYDSICGWAFPFVSAGPSGCFHYE